MKVTFELCTPTEFSEWDAFVESAATGTLFHTTEWLRCSSDSVMVHLARGTDGEILAGLPLVKVRRYGMSGYFPPPFTPYYGMVCSDRFNLNPKEQFAEYVHVVHGLLSMVHPWMSMDFHLVPGTDDCQPFIWAGFSVTVTYTFELSSQAGEFEANLFADRRANLRRAREAAALGQLCVEEEDDEDEFLSLVRSTAEHGGFRLDEKAVRSILRCMKGHYRLLVARDGRGTAVQGVLFPYDSRRGYLLISGTSREYFEKRASAKVLIIATLARFCQERNLVFDFEGSVIPRIAEYNHRFGATMKPCWRAQKSRNPIHYAARAIYEYVWKERKGSGDAGPWETRSLGTPTRASGTA